MADDYYKTLGISRDASAADIQKAYREMARKYHPDLHPDDKTAKKKFQEVQAAFDVLNDTTKREQYDRYGSAFEQMGRGGGRPQGAPGWSGAAPGGEDFDFSQIFGGGGGDPSGGFADIFSQFRRPAGGRAAGAASTRRGSDVASEVQIPFTTSVQGGEVQVHLERSSGEVETLTIKIPAGIEDGKKIRLRGQGEPAPRKGTPGDLLITVHVTPHPFVQRRGNNLDIKVPVTLAEAALGAKIDVPTPQGTISLRLPPGTSSGAKLRIKGHGVATKSGEQGDLYAEIQIVIPKPLDEKSQELIRQLDSNWKEQQPDPRRDLRW